MKKAIVTLIITTLTCIVLVGCGHKHEWQAATCEEPMICIECGEVQGSALGHTWLDATCEEPQTCDVCGKTAGEAKGHKWLDATCETPKTCEVCGKTEGEVAEHILDDTGKCTVCGKQLMKELTMDNFREYLTADYKLVDGNYVITFLARDGYKFESEQGTQLYFRIRYNVDDDDTLHYEDHHVSLATGTKKMQFDLSHKKMYSCEFIGVYGKVILE